MIESKGNHRSVFLVILFLATSCGVLAGYSRGHQKGFQDALSLQRGTLAVSLNALDKIRGGDVAGGTACIEALCFSSANLVYGQLRYDSDCHFVRQNLFDDLHRYRQTFHRNTNDWSPMERDLERNLAGWKRAGSP